MLPLAVLLAFACSDHPIAPIEQAEEASGLTVANAIAITDIRVASGEDYKVVDHGFRVGARPYTDRKYTFGSVPDELAGSTYIQTANDDQKIDRPGEFLSFAVDRDAIVYVAHADPDPPAWLRVGFVSTGLKLTTRKSGSAGKYEFQIFKKNVTAGTVILGGNNREGDHSDMYSVIVQPGAANPTPPDTATPPATAAPPPPDTASPPPPDSTAPPPAAVASVTVNPASSTIDVGESVRLGATVKDSKGTVLSDRLVSWSSSDASVATVDRNGRATAEGAGTATISATAEGVTGTATLRVTVPAPSAPSPPPSGGTGIWISPDEIAKLPTSGAAWDNVKKAANRFDPNTLCLGHNSRDDVELLAASFVAVRLNDPSYYRKVADGLANVVGKENDGTYCGGDKLNSLSLHRNFAGYVLAADIIDYENYDPAQEPTFRSWVAKMRDYEHPAGGGCSPGRNCSMGAKQENRPNNHGTLAGASRIAADLYLGDQADLDRAVAVFKGFLGDRSSYARFQFRTESDQDTRTWSPTPDAMVPINPKGATVPGKTAADNVDGAIIDDFSRGCARYQWEPCHTGYPLEGLAGLIVQAEMLYRQGYPVYDWEDQAIRRAYEYLLYLDSKVGYWWDEATITGDENWQPWIVNKRYGIALPTNGPTTAGKQMGWADWTHGH